MKDDLKSYLSNICTIKSEAMEELLDLFRPTDLSAKQFFVRAGAYADKVGFLRAGVVRAFFVNDAGKEYTKQFFVGPSLIGAYTSLLTQQANRIAQQALVDCEILEANYSDLEALYKKHHSLEHLGRKIAEFYFLEKEQKELEMGLLEADQRYDIFRDRFPHLESLIAQYHIASYLGISPTQLSRIRNKKAGF
jgi:CRP-like cAMP-binding protein